MSQPSIALIFNPAARGEKARSFRESLGQMQDECTLLETTAPGSAVAVAVECHAGPAPSSSRDVIGRPVPIRSLSADMKCASFSNSLNPNASSYVRGSS